MSEQQPQIQDAKARIEEALTALQGSQIPGAIGRTVTAALKVAKARINRLEQMMEDRILSRDKFALNVVTHIMVTGLYEPKDALVLAYKLADEALEVRRNEPL